MGIAIKLPQNNRGIKYNWTPAAPKRIMFIGSEINLLKDSLLPVKHCIYLANK